MFSTCTLHEKKVYNDREIKVRENKFTLTKVGEFRSRKKSRVLGVSRHQPCYGMYVVKLREEEVGFLGR